MKISIITSVYNCEKYFNEMAYSILSQSMPDWEWILIDDASVDSTWDMISAIDDSRLVKIRNKKNCGLTKNLNKAIDIAKGEYIVRMDGDDIAFPDRFEKQVKYMDEHPEVILSGCWARIIGNRAGRAQHALENDCMKVDMIFNSVILHPTFIMRKSIIEQKHIRYNEELRYAQDYHMIYQLSKYGDIANIPEILIKYRMSDSQVSSQKKEAQLECANVTRKLILRDLGIKLTPKAFKIWVQFCLNEWHRIGWREKKILIGITETIVERNLQRNIYNQDILKTKLKIRLDEYLS